MVRFLPQAQAKPSGSDKLYQALVRSGNRYLAELEPRSPQVLLDNPVPSARPVQPSRSVPQPPVAQPPVAQPKHDYDGLVVNLMVHGNDATGKTLAFVGCAQQTGVSTTVANLASRLASDGHTKVLVVDLNLRAPTLHTQFKVDPFPGVVDFVLSQDQSLVPVNVGLTKLFLLPRGCQRAEPVNLIGSKKFLHCLTMAREQFDYVLLDTPSINHFPDAGLIAAKVDGTVLVLQAGKTRAHVANRASNKLLELGSNVLGVVLNGRRHYIPEFIYRYWR